MAAVAVTVAIWKFWRIRGRVRRLRLGRDGERVVGRFLERLREGGGQVFHDIPEEGFNLDHVVISPHGLYAIETKTLSMPWPNATITEVRRVARCGRGNMKSTTWLTAAWLRAILVMPVGSNNPSFGGVGKCGGTIP
jgi:hypothetical protein